MREPSELWRQLADSNNSFTSALKSLFLDHEPELNNFLAQGLSCSVSAHFAIDVLMHLPSAYRIRFIRDLLELASYVNGSTNAARTAIFSIDRSWLLANIVEQMHSLLKDPESLVAMFQLAKEIDITCARAILDSVRNTGAGNLRDVIPQMKDELRKR